MKSGNIIVRVLNKMWKTLRKESDFADDNNVLCNKNRYATHTCG
jgi:hypothetical protein